MIDPFWCNLKRCIEIGVVRWFWTCESTGQVMMLQMPATMTFAFNAHRAAGNSTTIGTTSAVNF